MSQATCFVVQGFRPRRPTTPTAGFDPMRPTPSSRRRRSGAGLKCLQADEIPHFGVIGLPMYEMLLRSRLWSSPICSTYKQTTLPPSNSGVALRTRATIIVAEDQFKNPSDVNYIVIRRYKHLGEDLGVRRRKAFATT